MLKRVLLYNKYKIKHVMNITDVGHLTSDADTGEDKMEKGARREGKTAWDIANFYTKAFKSDLKKLNILFPNIWCKATDHIKEQIAWIKKLEKAGFTYNTADGIYFDTSKFKNYGKLAQLEKQKLQAGKRIDIGEKKNPTDFALWKFSPSGKKRDMEWDSPWGKGFPGWHIECSVMATKYLGQNLDIHCGGVDHIPIHHTNEIAQTEALTKKQWVNYWAHGEFLLIDNGKMAKSSGEFLTLDTLEEKGYSPEAYRYFCMNIHYKKQLNFSYEALDASKIALDKLKNKINEIKSQKGNNGNKTLEKNLLEEFESAINDDLNIPKALGILWDIAKHPDLSGKQKVSIIKKIDSVLGLNLFRQKKDSIPKEIILLAEKREKARAEKDWKLADELRNDISLKGYVIEDKNNSYVIRKNSNRMRFI